MNKSFHLLTLFNVRITFTPLCVVCYLILIPPITWLGITLRNLTLIEGLIASVFIIALMFVTETIHQLGHAWAAKSVGYPMIGIRHFSWFSTSMYWKEMRKE
ncbi:MAG: hypothetical protein HZB17_00945 [Chloroflexi bacterium]|nr:hypothetical protein [Chloroflexota bacterium]